MRLPNIRLPRIRLPRRVTYILLTLLVAFVISYFIFTGVNLK